MSYSDPDIDHTEFTPYQCGTHSPIAGMMHVHPEDLDSVAKSRPVECDNCDATYTIRKGWVL